MSTFVRHPDVVGFFEDIDRGRAVSTPLFLELKEKYNITHFYLIDPNKVVLHRSHAPERKGDFIDRHTLAHAARSGEMTTGLEFGTLGTFTLRTVLPVVKGDRVMGYLEVGKEISDILEVIERETGITILEIVSKDLLEGVDMQALKALNQREASSKLLSDHVVLHTKGADFSTEQINPLPQRGEEGICVCSRSRYLRALEDFSGDISIELLMISHNSDVLSARNGAVVRSILLGSLFILIGAMIFYVVAQRVENSTHRSRRHLEENKKTLEETLEDLRISQEELIQQEKFAALGGLVAGVAHEISTPIGNCITAVTHVEDLRHEIGHREDGHMKRGDMTRFVSEFDDIVPMIRKGLERAADLIKSFKQVSVDQNLDEERRVSLCSFLEETLTTLGPVLKRSIHKVEHNCTQQSVVLHPGFFFQILSNLINNSLIHGFEGFDDSGSIQIELKVENEQLILDYSDDGKGMDEEGLRKLFDPFYTTKRNRGGTGLGTHIIYNIVKHKLEGDITVVSEPGQGLQYHITFPIKP